jgi:hypothetical protein
LALAQLSKLFNCKARISHDTAHRISVYRIVARYRHDMGAIRHDDMLSLTYNSETRFFQGSNGILVIYARNAGHELNRHLDFSHISIPHEFLDGGKIFTDRVLYILDGLLFGLALRPTAWQAWYRHAITFV